MRLLRVIGIAALLSLLLVLPASADASRPNVAALQAALKSLKLYKGQVDGLTGPLTRRGLVQFQRSRHLPASGKADPRTRRALGWRGRPALGSRVMRNGSRGWDVAALQFLLQRGGFGAGRADGIFGRLTRQAVVRAQTTAGGATDGLAGPATIKFLIAGGKAGAPTSIPVSNETPIGLLPFIHPVIGPIGDGFGARRGPNRVHQGIDYPVSHGTPISASAAGTVIYAGWNSGGYGNLVVIQHLHGYTTWYAHLSTVGTRVGAQVAARARIGLVGSTGYSTGPHLHFEIRRFDTPLNPVPLLTAGSATLSVAPADADDHSDPHERHCDGGNTGGPTSGQGSWIARERLC